MNTGNRVRARAGLPPLRTVHISFSCDEDMARAILRFARDMSMPRSQAVRAMVRRYLLESPAQLRCVGFPVEQSLELWVWASQQARDRREPPPSFDETFVVSKDGENVIRLDFVTAA